MVNFNFSGLKMTDSGRRGSNASTISTSKVNALGATIFVLGCSVLSVNAVLTFLPHMGTRFVPPTWVVYVEGALSVVSSALFVAGGVFGLVYAVCVQQIVAEDIPSTVSAADCFGKLVEKDVHIAEPEKAVLAYPGLEIPTEEDYELYKTDTSPTQSLLQKLILRSHESWSHHVREIGFVITIMFLSSSTIFFAASIAAIISIAKIGQIVPWIRYPQLIGAVGFAVASVMMMLQTQKAWWRPAHHNLRWYVGLTNFIGSVGFIVCACFGLVQSDDLWARYHFGLSYFWGESTMPAWCCMMSILMSSSGAWAFLLASGLQWYKSVRKHAKEKAKAMSIDEPA